MPRPDRLIHEFEGKRITTYCFQDRVCWIARHIGALLGYSHRGKRFANKITGDWAEGLIPGHDYDLLQGDSLAELCDRFRHDDDAFPARASSLVVLYEPGMHLALARTAKPVGRRLRRFFFEEVLPRANANARGGANLDANACGDASASANANREERAKPNRGAGGPEVGAVHLHPRGRKVLFLDVQLLRERRLIAQHDLRKRMFQASSLRNTVQTLSQLGTLDREQVHKVEVLASEIALGLDADELMAELGHEGLFPPRTVTLEELVQRFNELDIPASASDEAEDTTTTLAAE